jgi:hypothetical protein
MQCRTCQNVAHSMDQWPAMAKRKRWFRSADTLAQPHSRDIAEIVHSYYDSEAKKLRREHTTCLVSLRG